MKVSEIQLPVAYEFTEEDIRNITISPLTRAYIETKLVDVYAQLVSLQVPSNVDSQEAVFAFARNHAFYQGYKQALTEIWNLARGE